MVAAFIATEGVACNPANPGHVATPRAALYGMGMTNADPKRLIRIARETGPEGVPEPLDLGQRVRELRKAKGWTLDQAATQAGLARSTLSKIENGQMSPTYEAVKKLAEGLKISVPQLFTAASKAQVSGRMSVTKSGTGQAHVTATYEHELLAMEEFDGWVRHEGEEFLYVLTGVIRLFTEFYEPVDLRRGDSAYYDATMGHNVISLSEEDATILWVTSLA
jgi:transcriptional regulator with XRE-family HTH domain